MFCKGYDAFTAIIKLSLAPCSQVVLNLKERATSAILPRSRKPPQPAREEPHWAGITAGLRQVDALCSEDTSFVSALCSLLWRKAAWALLQSYSELVAESNSTEWSVWVTASPSELQSQLVYPSYKWKQELLPLLFTLNSLLHLIKEHVWEEEIPR